MKALKSTIWALTLYLLDGLVLVLARCLGPAPDYPPDGRKRLVLVRPDALGDFVLWSVAFEGLDRLFPRNQYERVWIGAHGQKELAELFGFFDRCIAIDPRRFRRPSGLLTRIRQLWAFYSMNCDTLIHPVRSRDFLVGDSLCRAVSCPVKIASTGDRANCSRFLLWLGRRWYTKLIPLQEKATELEFNAQFMSAISGLDRTGALPSMSELASRDSGSLPKEPYFVVLPGAGWEGREWGIDKFIQAALRVQKRTSWLCVWGGGKNDRARFSEAIGSSQLRFENRIGSTSLPELLSLLCSAQIVITNETGGAHLAAACSKPVVAITGGGHFGRFAPWGSMRTVHSPMPCFGCNWQCVYPLSSSQPVPCIQGISLETVFEAIDQAIDSTQHV